MEEKRKRKKVWGVLMLLFILICSSITTQAAGKAKKALKSYEKILKSSSYGGIKTKCFALLDINRDGIKELIISDAEKRFAIYSYNGSRAVRVYKYTVVNDHSSEDRFSRYCMSRANYKQAPVSGVESDAMEVITSVYYVKSQKALCIESTSNDMGEWDVKDVYLTLSKRLKTRVRTAIYDAGGDELYWVDGKCDSSGKKYRKLINSMKNETRVRFNKNTASNRKKCGIVAVK